MIRVNLYKKLNTYFNLLVGTLQEEKFNMPLYNTDITLWKGVDNTIEFSIRNHDRKSVSFGNGVSLKFVAINQPLNQKIEKDMEVVNAALGRYKIVISDKELKDFDCGTFIGHVSVIDGENEELLYSGTDWYPYFNVEIKPNKMDLKDESETLDGESFNREIVMDMGREMEYFTSSVFKADKSPYHTITAKLKDFIGVVKLQGSTMETPGLGDSEWFDIYVKEYLDFEDNKPSEDKPSEDKPSDGCICREEGRECLCEDCLYDEECEDEYFVDGESYTLDELYNDEDIMPKDDGDCPFISIVDEETDQTYILPKEIEDSDKPSKPESDIHKPVDKPYRPHHNHHYVFPYPYHNYHPYLVFGSECYKYHHKPHKPYRPHHKKDIKAFTGTECYNGKLNCLWVRLQYIRPMDSKSTIEEITYRN